MNRFWESIIQPIFEKRKPKHIVEIGSDEGKNTEKVLEYCKRNDGKITVIDPSPRYDTKIWEKNNMKYLKIYKELSLNVLPKLNCYDIVLIDGDHNWYTVYNELKIIYKNNSLENFPIIILHDVSWPYARRDLYYNPENIPLAYRKPYAKKGIDPESTNLLEKGGLNSELCNSIYENSLQNGVLTAIEDFLQENDNQFKFIKISGFNGIGIIASNEYLKNNKELENTLQHLEVSHFIHRHIENIDKNLMKDHIRLLEYKSESLYKENKIKNIETELTKVKKSFEEVNKILSKKEEELQEYIKKIELLKKEKIELSNLKQKLNKKIFEQDTHIDDLNLKMEKYLEKINEIQKENKSLKNDIIKKQKELSKLNEENKSLKNDIIKKQKELSKLNEENKKLNSWMIQLNEGINVLLGSKRWKFSNLVGEFKRRVLFIKKQPTPSEFITNIMNQYQLWLKNNDILKYKEITKTRLQGSKYKNKMAYFIWKLIKNPGKKNILNLKAYLLLKGSYLFDEDYYLTNYPDVKISGLDPLIHYIYYGGFEGRNPSEFFDSKYYMRSNSDVKDSKMNPLIHYVFYGAKEGRIPKPNFVLENNKFSNDKIKQNSENLNTNNEKVKKIPFNYSEFNTLNMPKVSIILPTWNREKIIGRAIDSVLKQKYTNYELIIADDGSEDNTESYLYEKYKNEIAEGKIKYYKLAHGGVCKARNKGLELSTGELIAYIDSDNEWYDDYLSTMVNVFVSNPTCGTAYACIEVFDEVRNKNFVRKVKFDRKRLLSGNFIDLNIFMHRRRIYEQYGGFNEQLRRLVDWELIIRYTKLNEPIFIDKVLAKYYLNNTLNNISNTVALDPNRKKVIELHKEERISLGVDKLRIGYVLWDYPAFSQTFVFNELRWLVQNGYEVKVFYKALADKSKEPDFPIEAYKVENDEELAKLIEEHEINMLHTHFVYPACTLLTYPAAIKTNTPFTVSAHAVDIFHYANEKRNKINEISSHTLCKKVIIPGKFHYNYLVDRGVPSNKLIIARQAVRYELFNEDKNFEKRLNRKRRIISTIARFVEKKGLEDLIKAADLIKDLDVEIRIYGYGPLEQEYEELINKLQLKNVKLCGTIEGYENLKTVYKESDLFVLPCVRASNGDMDGIPTVILEAMSFGVPVISTDTSVIPEIVKNNFSGFIVPPKKPEALAIKIKEILNMNSNKLRNILLNARETVNLVAKIEHTMNTLIDIWMNRYVDIFLVTYDKDKYRNLQETKEIIDRIYKYTTTPFNLTIVDNGSEEEFKKYLHEFTINNDNVKLIELQSNIYCGPASNLAIENSNGDYIIYVCSKEGFIGELGWERECINYMRENNDVAIAGHIIASPKYYNGKTYMEQEWFSKFRNKNFAIEHPDRNFYHVQGGLYILRRQAYRECGGFSNELPHNYMDVEYSYYLESCGWKLGEIESIVSLTKKTQPNIDAFMDENTIAVHPLDMDIVSEFDYVKSNRGKKCNVCNWKGLKYDIKGDSYICPNCQSTNFQRSLYKYLAKSNLIYRNLSCIAFNIEKSQFHYKLNKMFKLETINADNTIDMNKRLKELEDRKPKVLIIQEIDWEIDNYKKISKNIYEALDIEGVALINSSENINDKEIIKELKAIGFNITKENYYSKVIQYDWKNILICKKS
ncbi:glycosyltransferase [Tepidibacter formicigenes]|jgi:glycosyltransferase involved in cell wall biosynthesis|uniref:Glycosyltransferase involved in cell wall bisynthesis n=1 Tax=Tepidibacter formicigenes DSM 15518 TaxID=1123349 RepID=A0A1M6QVI3_9FIRM|nr:glycosyltransferase [Tepidibacter formicigenes]SHK24150.1 Glycosyltransferase involved in cell wall bisynthesis [Tepidibacter formicigenes DSM 15518]